jgi:uncharacterized damage-inducible protein DinB
LLGGWVARWLGSWEARTWVGRLQGSRTTREVDCCMAREIIGSIDAEYRRYRELGERAIAQMTDEELSIPCTPDDNSVTVIVWHISGNLKSRFTDFLTSDGEKPWRKRDEEFAQRIVGRQQVVEKWNEGWQVLTSTLDGLTDDDLGKVVTIRQQPLKVHQALHRLMAHAAYHVGQIVFVAKSLRGADWHSLSIPKGQSEAFRVGTDSAQRSASWSRT